MNSAFWYKDAGLRVWRCLKETLPEPRILYLLSRLLFQLPLSIVDVRDAFVDIQHSGYVSRVVGGPR